MDSQEMSEKIWSYVDGSLASAEREVVERLISEHAAWKAEYQTLLAIHQSLNLMELEEPSMRFTRNVMDLIAQEQIAPAAKNYLNNRIIWGIGGFFVMMILGFLVYGFSQVDWSPANSDPGALGIDFEKVNFQPVLSNNFVNMFLVANVVIALFLFDRYLQAKKSKLLSKE